MFCNARYYSPLLSRFVSADSIVPNGEKASVIPLTVDFHEPMFLAGVAEENAFTLQNGFWSQLSGKQKEKAKLPWGPQNPQALNRYAYVLNNPLSRTDPTGHESCGDKDIGCEKIEIDGRIVYKLWVGDQEIFVEYTEETDDLITNFKIYANMQRDARQNIDKAFWDTIFHTTAGTLGVGIAVVSPSTGPLAPLVLTLGVGLGVIEYVNAVRSVLEMRDSYLAWLDARTNAYDYWTKLLDYSIFPTPTIRNSPR